MNTYTINSQALNSTVLLGEAEYDNISFNGYGLQNTQIITQGESLGIRDYPNRRINIVDTPQGDGAILNDTFFGGRTILLTGVLKASSSYALNDLIDEFKLNLSFADKVLRWRVNDEIRTINATVDSISFGTKDNIYIPFTVVFVSQDAFWKNGEISSINLVGRTSQIKEDISNETNSTYVKFIITFNSAVDVIYAWAYIGSIGILVTETITTGDILIIDGFEKNVTLNGVEVDYEGIFPTLEFGTNNIIISAFYDFNVDVAILYNNNII